MISASESDPARQGNKVALLTGGKDPSYVLPLLFALVSRGVHVEFIGSDNLATRRALDCSKVTFLNFHGDLTASLSKLGKVARGLRTYLKYLKYVPSTDAELFHVQWEIKIKVFDWIFMNLYYKLFGKKIVFTAHNINDRARDNTDTIMNRFTLRFLYWIVDHIIVHTALMRNDLVKDFSVDPEKISIVPFGINKIVPNSELSRHDAQAKFSFGANDRILLSFGNIAPYKGLDLLLKAFFLSQKRVPGLKLIIAGRIKKGNDEYWNNLKKLMADHCRNGNVLTRIDFIPDEEVEWYFKAADALVLAYRFIYQSGPLFLAYNFGLPVIATDVGSFKEDILEGKTGYIARPDDSVALSETITAYFQSDLFVRLDENRERIREYARKKYSWDVVGEKTINIYQRLLQS